MLVNELNDLIRPIEDIRIDFEPSKNEIRNVECGDLFLMNDNEKFNFNGRDFNGWDFNGRNFNGGDFNGKKISYYASFIAYNSIKCESIEGRRENSFHKCLDGEIEIVKPEEKPDEEMVSIKRGC